LHPSQRLKAKGIVLRDAPIYLDYQATTPLDPRVLDAMLPFYRERFGNPHSATHAYGWQAEEAVEAARGHVARLVGAKPAEIIFTSGATEANNLAIKGLAKPGGHIVTVATEHECVLAAAEAVERGGMRVTYLPVMADGLIDLDHVTAALTPETVLVSVMAVNNDIGVIQNIQEIAALAHTRGVAFHSDAAQAAGKIALDVRAQNIDLMSLSAHKLYGPMGLGALYVHAGMADRLKPLAHGGGQERGLRPGTLPTPLCVGFGEACRIALAEFEAEAARLLAMRGRLLEQLRASAPDRVVNGSLTQRIPGNLNIAFPGIEAEALIAALPELALATGSACSSAVNEPSHVLTALGLSPDLAAGSLRIGFGRFTTEAELDRAGRLIAAKVKELRPC
jgi:cysteine desulfurase